MIRPTPWVSVLLCVLGLAVSAQAGSVCGIVRDGSTQTPVPRAGVFLYQTNAYTGFSAATATDGSFCIDSVPAGTYDLQVRVDDYQTAWVAGIEVSDTATSVDVSAGIGLRLALPWPNPASSTVTFEFSSAQPVPMQMRIFDAKGRLVQGWSGSIDASTRTLGWDLKDRFGEPTASGLYFVQLQIRGNTITRPFVRVR